MGFEIKDGVLVRYNEEAGVTKVVIPDGVVHIGNSAFSDCESLTNVTIPNGVTSIGNWAFGYCSSLTNIVLPNGVTSVGHSAFRECCSMVSIELPASVTSIGDEAFMECKNLTDITIPRGVTNIEDRTFLECSNLVSIIIPDSVTSIGGWAFMNCSKLTNVTIPEGVKTLGNDAFGGCRSLTSVSIPKGVECIRFATFSECRKLKDVTIPDSVSSIEDSAFAHCENLRSISIPHGVKNIGRSAFSNCHRLKNVDIANEIIEIGDNAFAGCDALADVDGFVIVRNVMFDYHGPAEHVVIPNGVTRIAWSALPTTARSIVIPRSVDSMANRRTFRTGFPNLQYLAFPSTLTAELLSYTLSQTEAVLIVEGPDHNLSFLAYSAKGNSDNYADFVKRGNWTAYDRELINNGPIYKYTMPVRLVGMIGRLREPIDLSENVRQLFMEYLMKNAKKLVPMAEEFDCPEIIKAAYKNGVIDSKNEKVIRKLLAESKVSKIAALTDYHCN